MASEPEKLKVHMARIGMSESQLARAVGVSYATIYAAQKGEASERVENLICKVLGVKRSEVIEFQH